MVQTMLFYTALILIPLVTCAAYLRGLYRCFNDDICYYVMKIHHEQKNLRLLIEANLPVLYEALAPTPKLPIPNSTLTIAEFKELARREAPNESLNT